MHPTVRLMFVVCSIVHDVGTCSAQDVDCPKTLFIMLTDVGCDALAYYGGNSFKMPNLNALAGIGMLLRHCFSMPVCHRPRIFLLTGRYVFRLTSPVGASFRRLRKRTPWPKLCKSCGYATTIVGKLQLAMIGNELDHPHRLGFDPLGGRKLILRSLVGKRVCCAVGETENECRSEPPAGQASPNVRAALDRNVNHVIGLNGNY